MVFPLRAVFKYSRTQQRLERSGGKQSGMLQDKRSELSRGLKFTAFKGFLRGHFRRPVFQVLGSCHRHRRWILCNNFDNLYSIFPNFY